jgi:hypothetical protein
LNLDYLTYLSRKDKEDLVFINRNKLKSEDQLYKFRVQSNRMLVWRFFKEKVTCCFNTNVVSKKIKEKREKKKGKIILKL